MTNIKEKRTGKTPGLNKKEPRLKFKTSRSFSPINPGYARKTPYIEIDVSN
jgi:hypothetical protein